MRIVSPKNSDRRSNRHDYRLLVVLAVLALLALRATSWVALAAPDTGQLDGSAQPGEVADYGRYTVSVTYAPLSPNIAGAVQADKALFQQGTVGVPAPSKGPEGWLPAPAVGNAADPAPTVAVVSKASKPSAPAARPTVQLPVAPPAAPAATSVPTQAKVVAQAPVAADGSKHSTGPTPPADKSQAAPPKHAAPAPKPAVEPTLAKPANPPQPVSPKAKPPRVKPTPPPTATPSPPPPPRPPRGADSNTNAPRSTSSKEGRR